jgi:hypothetical protein
MPRKSESSKQFLHVVEAVGGKVEPIRLKPPKHLTPEQSREFVRVVQAMPPLWFCAGHLAVLVQYCRHVVLADHIAALIQTALVEGGANIERLLVAQARESKSVQMLATCLRLTPQATSPQRASIKTLAQVETPWQGARKDDPPESA